MPVAPTTAKIFCTIIVILSSTRGLLGELNFVNIHFLFYGEKEAFYTSSNVGHCYACMHKCL